MTSYERPDTRALLSARMADIGCLAALVLLLLVMAGNFYHFLVFARDAVSYPYELDYGEGIVWRQMAALVNGGMYSNFHQYPYLVFHYTPIYHVVSFLAAEAFGNPLAMGRVVSLLSALGFAVLIGTVVGQAAGRETPRLARFAGCLSAILVLFTFVPVLAWSPLMRVDMLASFFEMGGVALFLASLKRPRLFYLSAIVFVLAVYTKQSIISGALACFTISFFYRFAFTLRAFALAVAVGGGAMVVLTAMTDGEFPRHLFLYNINHVAWGNWRMVVYNFLSHSVFIIELAAVGAILVANRIIAPRPVSSLGAWRLTLRDHPESVARLTLLIYLSVTAILTIGILKSGASINYLIPAAGVSSIMFGLFVVELTRRLSIGTAKSLGAWPKALTSLVFLLCIWQIYNISARWTEIPSPEHRRAAEQVLERIEQAQGPIWSEDMTLAMIAGKDVIAEPAIVTELAMMGIWDQEPFLDWFRERKFDIVIITSLREFDRHPNSSERHVRLFTPEMKSAIESYYPVVEVIGRYRLYYPP